MFSKFTATVGDKVISWLPDAPFVTGDPKLVREVLEEVNAEAMIMLTPSGPRVISIETEAEVVFTVINNLYGIENVTYENAPDISKLWSDALPGEIEDPFTY